MNRGLLRKTLLIVVLIASVTCSVFLLIQNQTAADNYRNKINEQTAEIKNLKEDMAGLDNKLRQQQDLLDSREGFLESLQSAKTALSQAERATDTTKTASLIRESEEIVYQERTSPMNIDMQTSNVNKEVGRLLLKSGTNKHSRRPTITNADLQDEVEGLKTLQSDHPARQALDAVGGVNIMLGTAPVVCGLDNSLACAYPTGVILFAEESANEDYDFFYAVMMHEYAHQIQYKHREKMENAAGYRELFQKDIEWLADCMAAARIPGYTSNYHYSCTNAQIEYGRQAWKGNYS